MRLVRCDRCQEEVEGNDLILKTFKDKDFALCGECAEGLDKILIKINKVLDKQVGEFLNVNTNIRSKKRQNRKDKKRKE